MKLRLRRSEPIASGFIPVVVFFEGRSLNTSSLEEGVTSANSFGNHENYAGRTLNSCSADVTDIR